MKSDEPSVGRPRSEEARAAVLRAVDDLVVEVGYADLTMKAIAERAGVSRQTVYRWWSSKAEILFEAMAADASSAVAAKPAATTEDDLRRFFLALRAFLVDDPAGHAYRILIGAAQQDAELARLMRTVDIITPGAHDVLKRARARGDREEEADDSTLATMLTAPVLAASLGVGLPVDVDQYVATFARVLRSTTATTRTDSPSAG